MNIYLFWTYRSKDIIKWADNRLHLRTMSRLIWSNRVTFTGRNVAATT